LQKIGSLMRTLVVIAVYGPGSMKFKKPPSCATICQVLCSYGEREFLLKWPLIDGIAYPASWHTQACLQDRDIVDWDHWTAITRALYPPPLIGAGIDAHSHRANL
jgi:hypothetical protein